MMFNRDFTTLDGFTHWIPMSWQQQRCWCGCHGNDRGDRCELNACHVERDKDYQPTWMQIG